MISVIFIVNNRVIVTVKRHMEIRVVLTDIVVAECYFLSCYQACSHCHADVCWSALG